MWRFFVLGMVGWVAGCTLTVDLPTARRGTQGDAGGGGAAEEGGAGGDEAVPDGEGSGGESCDLYLLADECLHCEDDCCSELEACELSVACLCWVGCLYEDGVPYAACEAVCGPADGAVSTVQACLANACPACATNL